MTESRKIERECPSCGIRYKADPVRLKHGRQTTCSRACSYKLRADQRANSITVDCSTCGTQITRCVSSVKSKHEGVYCSRRCHYAGRSLGLTDRVVSSPYVRVAPPLPPEHYARVWATRRENGTDRHGEETRARLREATTRAIAEGRVPTISKLEDIVAAVLDDMGVAYVRQVAIRGAHGRYVGVVDFLLADGRALEVNGTFWHTDPRVYPNGPEYPVQRRNVAAWERKMAALEHAAIEVICAWEQDIHKDPAEAIRIALSAV